MVRGTTRTSALALAALGTLTAAALSFWGAGYFDAAAASGAASVTGEVLVGADGRTLTASVFWNGCEDRPSLVAHEAADAVTLDVVRHRHAPADAVCDDGKAEQMTVSLANPLGNRRLGSPGDASGMATFPAAKLRQPSYLPPGYAQAPAIMLGEFGPPMLGGHFVAPPAPSWERGYAGSVMGHGTLMITQTAGESASKSGESAVVNGHPARLTVVDSTQGKQLGETLTWFDGTYTMTVEEQDPDLTPGDVLRVAQGLH